MTFNAAEIRKGLRQFVAYCAQPKANARQYDTPLAASRRLEPDVHNPLAVRFCICHRIEALKPPAYCGK